MAIANSPFHHIDITIVARDWVINKLMFIGRRERATGLKSYWEIGGSRDMIRFEYRLYNRFEFSPR